MHGQTQYELNIVKVCHKEKCTITPGLWVRAFQLLRLWGSVHHPDILLFISLRMGQRQCRYSAPPQKKIRCHNLFRIHLQHLHRIYHHNGETKTIHRLQMTPPSIQRSTEVPHGDNLNVTYDHTILPHLGRSFILLFAAGDVADLKNSVVHHTLVKERGFHRRKTQKLLHQDSSHSVLSQTHRQISRDWPSEEARFNGFQPYDGTRSWSSPGPSFHDQCHTCQKT